MQAVCPQGSRVAAAVWPRCYITLPGQPRGKLVVAVRDGAGSGAAAVPEHLQDVVSGVWGGLGSLGPFLAAFSFAALLLAGCCSCLSFCCPQPFVLKAWRIRISWVMDFLGLVVV